MPQPERLRLAAAGDAFIARRLRNEQGGRFERLIALLHNADAAFVNLETLFHTFEHPPASESGGTYAAAEPALADELRWAGFTLYACANNHAADYGAGGLLSTVQTLDALGLVHAGTGRTLAEARAPAFLDTPAGRVALISASSTFSAEARAGDQRTDVRGRPGVNPLRFQTTYAVDAEAMAALRRITDGLHLEELARQRLMWDLPLDESVYPFLERRFVEAETFGIHSSAHAGDLAAHLRWIGHARRQADWVLVSLHSHEFETTKDVPAAFMVEFARACIDAGADAFIGHGPHLLRGIELYRDRPIFYGLGNFIFQNDLVLRQPADLYEQFQMPPEATPADLYDRRTRNDTLGFAADARYWESVVVACELRRDGPPNIRLHPIELGFGGPRSLRGSPRLAEPEHGRAILDRLAALCVPFGTTILADGDAGVLASKRTPASNDWGLRDDR
jgi:poly-gamma-glutamate capsule biosynthesis protein CapA/YwtB (metallophosphatase superfamily)